MRYIQKRQAFLSIGLISKSDSRATLIIGKDMFDKGIADIQRDELSHGLGNLLLRENPAW